MQSYENHLQELAKPKPVDLGNRLEDNRLEGLKVRRRYRSTVKPRQKRRLNHGSQLILFHSF